MTFVAVVGLGIAAYLLAARVLGEAPACGPVKGCETVAASEYATMFGVPVALFGVVFSVDPRDRLRHVVAARRPTGAVRGVRPRARRDHRGRLPDLSRGVRHRGDLRLVRRLCGDDRGGLGVDRRGGLAHVGLTSRPDATSRVSQLPGRHGRGVPGQLHVPLAAERLPGPSRPDHLRALPVDDPGRGAGVQFLRRDRRLEGDLEVLARDLDRPARWIVGAGGRADPAVGDLDLEGVPIEVPDRPVALDDRAVDERVGAVGVADERERQVGAVVEVDGEPVPAAAADRDEVAPLVVEPGRALDRERATVESRDGRSRSSPSASSSTSRRPGRNRSSRRDRGGPPASSPPEPGRARARRVNQPATLRRARAARAACRCRSPRTSPRAAARPSPGATDRRPRSTGRSRAGRRRRRAGSGPRSGPPPAAGCRGSGRRSRR